MVSLKRTGAVATYNGEIVALRRDGYSLQRIGDVIGVTRERVRQILNEYYGGTAIPLLAEKKVSKLCGCSPQTIRRLEKQEIIKPKIRGLIRYYGRDEVEKIYLALQGKCAMCGEPIMLIHQRKYCDKCRAKRRRSPWFFRSPESRKKIMAKAVAKRRTRRNVNEN